MNVLVVSGIWPPDVGGPASHAPELAAFLLEHDHRPHALVTADVAPAPEAYPVDWIPRSSPPGLRHLRGVARVRALARTSDVVYATGMLGRSAAGSTLAGRPFVVKLTADPAYERAWRLGLTRASLEGFQRDRGLATLPLRGARNAIVGRAAHVVAPSTYLRDLALAWGAPEATVLPNPTPDVRALRPREELRAELGFAGQTVVFAGRLAPQKALHVAIGAAQAAQVELVIAGDGPERAALERLGHARFLGPQPRSRVLELFRAADASILSSSWENFPHGAVESLAAGTPVVATDVGGVGEVVRDGVNGLLAPAGDEAALAAALRRLAEDGELRDRLQAGAAPSVADYSRERVYGRLLDILNAAAR
jgi:glycosyltransferase involved in cell wall biosynthesis